MMSISFIAVLPGLLLAALAPPKVSDVKGDSSLVPAPETLKMIYVKTFSISDAGSKSENAERQGRPHLLGALRGGEQNTVVGEHREAQQEHTLAEVPVILQKALIEDLGKSIAPGANGDGVNVSPGCWMITGEFVEVDTGNRALQAGVGLGAGQSHLQVRAKVYSAADMKDPFLTFDSEGASGHMPGAAVAKNPYVAAAKFVISKKEPEREAKKVAKSIADEIGKFMAAHGIPTLKSAKEKSAASTR